MHPKNMIDMMIFRASCVRYIVVALAWKERVGVSSMNSKRKYIFSGFNVVLLTVSKFPFVDPLTHLRRGAYAVAVKGTNAYVVSRWCKTCVVMVNVPSPEEMKVLVGGGCSRKAPQRDRSTWWRRWMKSSPQHPWVSWDFFSPFGFSVFVSAS